MVDCTYTFLVSIRSCSQSDFNLKKKKNVTRVTVRTLTLTSIMEINCSTLDKETETFKGNTRIHEHLIGKLHEEV